MSHELEISLGIVTRDKHVLLVERKKKETFTKGYVLGWVFPGGMREDDETRAQTAVREVLEETGYSVRANRLLHQGIHPISFVNVAYWACDVNEGISPRKVEDPNIVQHTWVPLGDLSGYVTTPVHPAVDAYLASL